MKLLHTGRLFKLECIEVNLVLVLSVNGPLHMGLLFKWECIEVNLVLVLSVNGLLPVGLAYSSWSVLK